MSFEEKIKNAKSSNWLTEGLTESQVKRIVRRAVLKAKIELFIREKIFRRHLDDR